MRVNVRVRETTIPIDVGEGSQRLKWLSMVALQRYEADAALSSDGDIYSQVHVATGLMDAEGSLLPPNKSIRVALTDGQEVFALLQADDELGGSPVALIDARFLVELAKKGGRLRRRQDLPPSCFLDLDKLRSDLDARLARDAANAARRDLAAQGLDGAAGARLRAASAAREQKLASEAHGARATNQELREELAKTKAALAATRAALGASTRDNEEYSAIRQQVVADAFAAATATSRANQRSAGTQCGPEGRLRFAAAPRGPTLSLNP